MFGKDDDGTWVEHTPELGSFLERVYFELKSMYDFSTGGQTGGGGGTSGGGNSFSNWFINLFNNDNINANIKQERSKPEMRGAFHQEGFVYLDFKTLEKGIKAYTENGKFEKMDLFLIIAHELAHVLSFNLIDKSQINYKWIDVPGCKEPISIDEVFATIVENQFRSERQSIPLRTHYIGSKFDPTTFEKSRIYNQNKETGQFEITTPALNIFNNYKKSIQNKGIQWKD